VTVRLPKEILREVEVWLSRQGEELNRSTAIRRLVEIGLNKKAK
jgi:metal-responsive CopG/Arc/MetJ family transcriptional regulator